MRHELPWGLGGVLRFYVGVTGALILLAAVTTSVSGLLPARVLARRARAAAAKLRAAEPPRARLAAGDPRRRGHLVGDRHRARRPFKKDDVAFLASLFSFGVLLAFTAAQLAVIKLRIDEPDLPRPYRAPFSVTIRGQRDPAARDRRRGRDVRGLGDRDGDASRPRATPARCGCSSGS